MPRVFCEVIDCSFNKQRPERLSRCTRMNVHINDRGECKEYKFNMEIVRKIVRKRMEEHESAFEKARREARREVT